MLTNSTFVLLPVAAYLLGSIPFGLLLWKIFGRADVRKAGSGNIGATNVARVAGPVAGVMTLLLDGAKGAAAVLLAGRFTNDSAAWMMISGLVALVGHCFPIWLKFKGGKGVATAGGVFLALCPLAFLGSITVFILVVMFWEYVSLGSAAAAASMPLLIYFLWAPRYAPPPIVAFGSLVAALLIIYKHAANIERLLQGQEPKFTFSKNKGAQ